ncbi:EGF-like calcium-binding [Artemisia annua]|uniref:EGF-like calcium-binding n=1 Tax=Artemisia annua TaxID=35608 RepID=A0A2U1Q3R7_ARTAN|nr:EGF-like calcium-binding [Artemisia annua]
MTDSNHHLPIRFLKPSIREAYVFDLWKSLGLLITSGWYNKWISASDINECDDLEKFPCYGKCQSTLGNYTCRCKEGYYGDGMTKDGCRRKPFHVLRFSIDINECDDLEKFPCYGKCQSTLGNYTCRCKEGYYGDGMTKDGCRRKPFHVLRFSIGIFHIF